MIVSHFSTMGVAILVVAIVAATINRRRIGRVVERDYVATRAIGADGVVQGAEGFTLAGTSGRGLLLLHGSGDTPQSLRYLASRFHLAGYSVHVPLLPGHGRSPRAFAHATSVQYLDAARDALQRLRESSTWVGVVGLSMGGALSVQIASTSVHVRVLVLLAPYLITPETVRVGVRTSWLWSLFAPYLRGGGDTSVHDIAARLASHAYGTFSAGALRALDETAVAGRRALSRLSLPVLVINSEQDNRIPRALAQQALHEIHSPVEEQWVTGCGHVITVDYCKDVVASLVLTFLARHAE